MFTYDPMAPTHSITLEQLRRFCDEADRIYDPGTEVRVVSGDDDVWEIVRLDTLTPTSYGHCIGPTLRIEAESTFYPDDIDQDEGEG